MSKKSQRKKASRKRSSSPQFSWPWLAAGGAVLLAAIILLWQPWSGDKDEAPKVSPQVSGRPRLSVQEALVDEGYIKYDVPIRTTFRLGNAGDQPLEILGQPQVKLVEGC